MQVTDWCLNSKTQELEWEVFWHSDEFSWEPNSHFAKHRQLIWAFLGSGTTAANQLPALLQP
eukprot:3263509-Rhodomonas_salina.1